MNLTQVAAPAKSPLEPATVAKHLRVQDAGEETLIDSYTLAAAAYVGGREGVLGRSLITQTWDLKLHSFPRFRGVLKLPFPPLKEVISIKWIDADGVEQTMSAADYVADPGEYIGRVRLRGGIDWPGNLSCDPWSVIVRFRVGYGDDPDDIPMPIRQAMLLIIGHWYENRSQVEACELNEIPMGSTTLLSSFIVTELVL